MLILEIPGARRRGTCRCLAYLSSRSSLMFCLTAIHQFIELQRWSKLLGQTQSDIGTPGNRLERDSQKSPTADSNLRLLFDSGSRQRCRMLLPWTLPEMTRGSVMLRAASSLLTFGCPAQAGSRSTWLRDSAASASLLLPSEFSNTKQTLLSVSSQYTSPGFADLRAQLVAFSKLWF